jgi:hypothetical protein
MSTLMGERDVSSPLSRETSPSPPPPPPGGAVGVGGASGSCGKGREGALAGWGVNGECRGRGEDEKKTECRVGKRRRELGKRQLQYALHLTDCWTGLSQYSCILAKDLNFRVALNLK